MNNLEDMLNDAKPYSRTWEVSRFTSARDNQPKRETWTWADLCTHLTPDLPAHGREDTKTSSPAFSASTFTGERCAEKVEAVSMLVWDYDDGTPLPRALAPWRAFRWAAYASWSNTAAEDGTFGKAKFRLVIPLVSDVPPDRWSDFWKGALHRAAGSPDKATKDASRLWFLPRQPSERTWWSATSAPDAPLMRWEDIAEQGRRLPPDAVLAKVRGMSLRVAGDALLRRLRGEKGGSVWGWPGTDLKDPDDDGTPQDPHMNLCPAGTRPTWAKTRRIMGGGLRPDAVYLVTGPTKRGKTSWALNVAEGAARTNPDAPVLFVSAELGVDEAAARLVALRSQAPAYYRSILRGRFVVENVEEAIDHMVEDLPNFYAWAPEHGDRTPDALAAAAEAVSAAHGYRPVLLVMDYLQRFQAGDGGDLRLQIREVSARLRGLSRSDRGRPNTDWWPKDTPWGGAAVVVLSSIPRGAYKHLSSVERVRDAGTGPPEAQSRRDRDETTVDDLLGCGKESGELEYDAAVVAVLTANDDDGLGGTRTGIVRVVGGRYVAGGSILYNFDGARGIWREKGSGSRRSGTPVKTAKVKPKTRSSRKKS